MSSRSKRECIEAVFLGYKNASKAEKDIILDEFSGIFYHQTLADM